jgi:hypothetical protein
MEEREGHGGILPDPLEAGTGHQVMSIEGYMDYQRREFCKDVKCPVQMELDAQEPDSDEYEKIRSICKGNCRYTTYQFHHWLIEKGYLIVRPQQ